MVILLRYNNIHDLAHLLLLPHDVRLVISLTIAAVVLATTTVVAETRSINSDAYVVPAIDSTVTLENYISIATTNRSGLKAAYFRWQESQAMTSVAGAFENPLLSYEYGYNKFSDPIGPQHQKFGIMQPIPWFGTLGAKKRAASFNSDAMYQRYVAEELSTESRVKTAYYQYYFVGRQLALTQVNFELMRQFESVIRTRYQTGLAMHPDLIKAQIELGLMEEMIRSMEQMLVPAQARLLAQLNLPDTVRLPLPREFDLAETEFSDDSLLVLAERYNPNLASMKNQSESRRLGVTVAKKMSLPEFMIGIEYERATLLNDMTGEKETMNDYMLNVQLSLPIWFGKNRAMRNAARAELQMSEQMQQEESNELAAMIKMNNFEYRDALRKLRLYRDGLIPKAKESLNATFTAYQAGIVDFLMLLDAQRQLLEFELSAVRAKVDAATKLAELELNTGMKFATIQVHK